MDLRRNAKIQNVKLTLRSGTPSSRTRQTRCEQSRELDMLSLSLCTCLNFMDFMADGLDLHLVEFHCPALDTVFSLTH